MALLVQGTDGPARNKWPQNIAYRSPEEILTEDANIIPNSLEGIAETMVVDRRSVHVTDRGRRMGLFMRSEDKQQHAVTVKLYGFIKSCSLLGNGDWKGSEYSASRAMLWLELEGKGCREAFEPQLQFLQNARLYAAQMLQGDEDLQPHNTLRFRHVVFRKTADDEANIPVQYPVGEDPTGRLKRIAKQWRLNPRPTFLRRDNNGKSIVTTPASFNCDDFVEVVATLDTVYKDKRGRGINDVSVHLAMRELTRLFTANQLNDMQIPAALLLCAPKNIPPPSSSMQDSMITDNKM